MLEEDRKGRVYSQADPTAKNRPGPRPGEEAKLEPLPVGPCREGNLQKTGNKESQGEKKKTPKKVLMAKNATPAP